MLLLLSLVFYIIVYVGRTKDAQAKYRANQIQKAIDYLGGKCSNCGSTENLEFDHIKPTTKLFTIAGNILKNWNKLIAELDKCQLLCHNDHQTKTLLERGYKRAKHGTYTMYNNHKCRCSPCQEAHTNYHRQYRAR